MLLLSPEKLLVVLAVAMVVIGPDKLPKLASQIGALWRDFQKWRERIEREARGVFPDLPSLHTIEQAVRSPLTLLDRLAATEALPPKDDHLEPRSDRDPDRLSPDTAFDPSMN